jgi:hypothetical protein
MPNSYHYFESGEVSYERLLLEIELLKQLQEADLLDDLDWTLYDTSALVLFVQSGIREANHELSLRHTNHSDDFQQKSKQYHFIYQCIRKHQTSQIKEKLKHQSISWHLIIIFIFICLAFVIGLYIKFDHQHRLLTSLAHSLTAKRRHLSFTNDLPIILLTFASAIVLGCTIAATRFSRKIILVGIFALLLIVILLIKKAHHIITFLSTYRELRWPMLYDYMYS